MMFRHYRRAMLAAVIAVMLGLLTYTAVNGTVTVSHVNSSLAAQHQQHLATIEQDKQILQILKDHSTAIELETQVLHELEGLVQQVNGPVAIKETRKIYADILQVCKALQVTCSV
jgi:cell division protein FtsB